VRGPRRAQTSTSTARRSVGRGQESRGEGRASRHQCRRRARNLTQDPDGEPWWTSNPWAGSGPADYARKYALFAPGSTQPPVRGRCPSIHRTTTDRVAVEEPPCPPTYAGSEPGSSCQRYCSVDNTRTGGPTGWAGGPSPRYRWWSTRQVISRLQRSRRRSAGLATRNRERSERSSAGLPAEAPSAVRAVQGLPSEAASAVGAMQGLPSEVPR
jgi:hypothetical protein